MPTSNCQPILLCSTLYVPFLHLSFGFLSRRYMPTLFLKFLLFP